MIELWEKEKQRLSTLLFEKVTKGKDKVTYNEILTTKVPLFFEGCIINQARKFLSNDSPIRFENQSRYNIEKFEIKKQIELIKELLIRETIFTKSEIQHLSSFSVNFQFDILVRPRQKIVDSVFKSSNLRKKEDILIIINGFGENRPFIQKLIKALKSLELESINREEFISFSKAVEQRIYKNMPISTFLKEMSLLMEFETTISGVEKRTIHSQVILGMLRERGLHEMFEALKEEAAKSDQWSTEDVENALERFLLVGPIDTQKHNEIEKVQPVANLMPLFDNSSREEVNVNLGSPKSEEPISESNSETLSEIMVVESDKDDIRKSKSSQFDYVQISRTMGKSRFSNKKQNFAIERDDIENQPTGPFPKLTSIIKSKDRKAFIKKIFNKDKMQYIEFIDRLDNQDNWKDAKSIIDEELIKRQIDQFSKEAVNLGDVVFSRYFCNEK